MKRALYDDRLTTAHLSLYTALHYLWQTNNCRNPVPISRRQVMPLAKISSYATYHKTIRDLITWNYISYQPTYNYRTSSTTISILFVSQAV